MRAVARANANVALVKYWGKRDESLVLPQHGSISLTLDGLSTTVRVAFDPALGNDDIRMGGLPAGEKERGRVSAFLDLVRHRARTALRAAVDSESTVPLASGLASSAAAYAALALAASAAAGLSLDAEELSRLARQGSGSACRSIHGGFVEWQRGEAPDGSDSIAHQLLVPHAWEVCDVIALCGSGEKEVSSRDGMRRSVNTSIFYPAWLAAAEHDLTTMRLAIADRNFTALGLTAERNALRMHATALGADPPIRYWNAGTLAVMERVERLRATGISAYCTVDAGPHVHVLTPLETVPSVQAALADLPMVHGVLRCGQGGGATLIEAS
ncbi:MAG: diphosphomevalonate decarboxylase [Thermaerobacter sp.]|nr:diphosphomevalonate decarboxylase [Thermaerobacter sp.]